MKRSLWLCIIIGGIAFGLLLAVTACENPTPTPTQSPISPVPLPEARAFPDDPVTDTIRLFWDDPLVPTGTARIGMTTPISTSAGYQITYTCDCESAEESVCVNYPYSRIIPETEITSMLTFEFALMVDFEARVNDLVVDTYTIPTGMLGSTQPGTGQHNSDIPVSWMPNIPAGYFGDIEIWKRGRWIDVDGHLPDVFVAYNVKPDGLREPDERMFFLAKIVTLAPELHVVYMPIVMHSE